MKANENLLTKKIHFPVLMPLKTEKGNSILNKVKSFATYRRKFRIEEDGYVYSKKLRQYIFIPSGFVMDGASVPKVLYFAYSSTGVLFYGAFPHDFGYRYAGLFLVDDYDIIRFIKFKKSDLDNVFLELCSQENHMPIISKVAKTALSLFGFLGGWSNRKQNNDVKKDFPGTFELRKI